VELIRQHYPDLIFLTLIGIGIGVIFGLVPLIYGRMKGKPNLALTGFLSCIAAGAIWSVLPLITMLVFTFLIIRKTETPESAKNTEPGAETPSIDDQTS
jgi:hypothetical protein